MEWPTNSGKRGAVKAGVGFKTWRPTNFKLEDLPAIVGDRMSSFLDAGVFVQSNIDEREKLRASYERNRTQAPFFVTMTTTLDCNMRCYYCYQKDGLLEHMSELTCDAAIAWSKEQIEERGHSSLNVDWYGGEPMLNQAVISRYSSAMIHFCESRNVRYKASMISTVRLGRPIRLRLFAPIELVVFNSRLTVPRRTTTSGAA